jgi:single-stranded DNA-binding protein
MQKPTINKVEVAGFVGRDAEQKSERAPIKFSVATGGDNKADGTGKWPLAWHQIVCWPATIPDAIAIKKGDYVRVHGRLNYNQWQTPEGQKRTIVEVVVFKLILEPTAEPKTKPLTPQASQPISNENMPF